MKEKPKIWICKKGHETKDLHKPDVCRECKKTETALWLSHFTEKK